MKRQQPHHSGSERDNWRSGGGANSSGSSSGSGASQHAGQAHTERHSTYTQHTSHQQHQHQSHHQSGPRSYPSSGSSGRWEPRRSQQPLHRQAPAGDIILSPPLHIQRQRIDEEAAARAAASASASASASSSAAASNVVPPASSSSSDIAPRGRFAFATLVMLGDDYVAGALALAHSLRSSGSRAELVVLVTPDVSAAARAHLALLFDEVVEVGFLQGRAVHKEWKRFTSGAQNGQKMYGWLDKSFTKLRVLGLTQYDLLVLLDADMIASGAPGANPDDLFSLRAPAAICALFGEKDPAAHQAAHGRPLSPAQVAQAIERSWGMRGCLTLLRPNSEHMSLVCSVLSTHGGYGERRLFLGADEKLLSDLYLDQWSHVHQRFGLTSWKSGAEYTGRPDTFPPVFLHFVTEKPWRPAPIDVAGGSGATVWPDYHTWYRTARRIVLDKPALWGYFARHIEFMQPHVAPEDRLEPPPSLNTQASASAATTAAHTSATMTDGPRG